MHWSENNIQSQGFKTSLDATVSCCWFRNTFSFICVVTIFCDLVLWYFRPRDFVITLCTTFFVDFVILIVVHLFLFFCTGKDSCGGHNQLGNHFMKSTTVSNLGGAVYDLAQVLSSQQDELIPILFGTLPFCLIVGSWLNCNLFVEICSLSTLSLIYASLSCWCFFL